MSTVPESHKVTRKVLEEVAWVNCTGERLTSKWATWAHPRGTSWCEIERVADKVRQDLGIPCFSKEGRWGIPREYLAD